MRYAMNPQSITRQLLLNVFLVAMWLAVGDCQGSKSVGGERWSQWGRWGYCDVTCGGGFRVRIRKCITNNCKGEATEKISCNYGPCPVLGPFEEWKECSATCGNGFQDRTRRCLLGDCNRAELTETRTCKLRECEGIMIFDTKSDHLQLFNPADNTLKQMQSFNEQIKSSTYTAVTLDDYIYVLMKKKLVYRIKYSDGNATWERMRVMIHDHGMWPPATVMSGCIYVVGGGLGRFTSAGEKFDPSSNKWSSIKHKQVWTESNGLVAMQGFIYSIGGQWGKNFQKIVERFDPVSSTWKFVAPMKQAPESAAAVEFNGRIYVLSILSRNKRLSTVEIYNPSTNTWSVMKRNIPNPQYSRSAFVINGDLYAVGWDEYHKRHSIERYSSKRDVWEEGQMQPKGEIYISASTKVAI